MTLLVVVFWLSMLCAGLYIGLGEWFIQSDRDVSRMLRSLEDEK